jgi:hypothetical protein
LRARAKGQPAFQRPLRFSPVQGRCPCPIRRSLWARQMERASRQNTDTQARADCDKKGGAAWPGAKRGNANRAREWAKSVNMVVG